MLSRKGNPGMDDIATIFGAICKKLSVAIQIQVVETS